ncbi:MAG: hypothetical protein ACFNLD_07475, partial [Kingella oralis]
NIHFADSFCFLFNDKKYLKVLNMKKSLLSVALMSLLLAACALEAASTAAFCAAEAADAPSAATVEAASCAAEAAWLAAGLLSPQAASNKDIKATDSSDFFMFNTFKYFLSLNKKQNESAK